MVEKWLLRISILSSVIIFCGMIAASPWIALVHFYDGDVVAAVLMVMVSLSLDGLMVALMIGATKALLTNKDCGEEFDII